MFNFARPPQASPPQGVIVPVQPEARVPAIQAHVRPPEPFARYYRSENEIIIENGAKIPTAFCIRSGMPSDRTFEVSLRNPADPLTWFGRRPTVTVGLSRRHFEDHSVAVALTWYFLAVGALLFAVGLIVLSTVSLTLGLLGMGVAGCFRASSPVSSPDVSPERTIICGAGDEYLKRIPERGDD